MSPSRKRLERLERKLEKALYAREESEDPLRGLVELPPQDMGERSEPLQHVLERRGIERAEQQAE